MKTILHAREPGVSSFRLLPWSFLSDDEMSEELDAAVTEINSALRRTAGRSDDHPHTTKHD